MSAKLIKRLENLDGPDWEVDGLIHAATMPPIAGGYYHWPPYTASLDAAIALVDRILRPEHPGMTIKIDGRLSPRSDYWFTEITWPSHEQQGRHRSPAIALLIALLRAAPPPEPAGEE